MSNSVFAVNKNVFINELFWFFLGWPTPSSAQEILPAKFGESCNVGDLVWTSCKQNVCSSPLRHFPGLSMNLLFVFEPHLVVLWAYS